MKNPPHPSATSALAPLLILVAATVPWSFTASPASGQVVPHSLSLEDAVEVARGNSPRVARARNDEVTADWALREAWGQLLPGASISSGISWQGSGETRLPGNVTLGDLGITDQPSIYGSNYNIGLTYALDWATVLGPRREEAARRTTLAQIEGTEWQVVTEVTAAYIEVRRQQENVRIAQLQLESSEFNLRLAQGQLQVGQVTPIDVGQAEVQVGRSEVTVLQAQNALTTSRMRLLQLLGVPIEQDFEVTTPFELTEPDWQLDDLTARALEENPDLEADRLSHAASAVARSSAWSGYLPSLSLSAGWSGFTREASNTDLQIAQAQAQVAGSIQQCVRTNDLFARLADPLPPMDCGQLAFTDAQRNAIVSANDQFPFDFIGSPPIVQLSVSIPIFQGFSRQRSLEQSRVDHEDAAETVRERELSVRADAAIGLENARTAYQSAELEERNRALAQRQLDLARERYRVGAITFVELIDAQTVAAQAEVDRARAVYDYHDSITDLEALLGSSLRFQN